MLAYLEDRQPFWGERHYADHVKMAKAGGEVSKRGVKRLPDGSKPMTMPGPVFELLALPLRDLTPARIEVWASEHAKARPTFARLCWRCLKVFLNWCAEQPEYAHLLASDNPAKTKRAREVLGKPAVKSDALQREQLAAWFAAVRQVQSPTVAAYLQAVLLTGARPGEVLTLRWEDVNTQWKGLTIRDKVEGERVIPLTPYVAHLLAGLRRRSAVRTSIAKCFRLASCDCSWPCCWYKKAASVGGLMGVDALALFAGATRAYGLRGGAGDGEAAAHTCELIAL